MADGTSSGIQNDFACEYATKVCDIINNIPGIQPTNNSMMYITDSCLESIVARQMSIRVIYNQ